MSRVTLIKPRRIGDDRGWFSETYKLRDNERWWRPLLGERDAAARRGLKAAE